MKYTKFIIPLLCFSLASCNKLSPENEIVSSKEEFGVFLGLDSSHKEKIYGYKNVAIEIEDFPKSTITSLKEKNTEVYAYLSVGSLEKYRSYYSDFYRYTFMDYDNWPDERWIDVSVSEWQDHLLSEANRFKEYGASGLFLDNFDVYYIASEEYDGKEEFAEQIYQGCKDILNNLSKSGLKILINSGSTFLERLDEENDSLLDKIDWYAQETVFSSIVDYENDIFAKQDKEEQEYYLDVIKMMKNHSQVLLIEYTKDENLVKEINNFAKNNNVFSYISSSVNLN